MKDIRLKDVNIMDALDDNMLQYTSYVLTDRVLPRIEDGYRCSQRRILLTMEMMKANKFTKCQQVDGQVIGKLHPHGGVYGVMVNMTTKNYQNIQPIIGKGNFGDKNSKNLTPAAARYTECKLSELATDMLNGIKENEVDLEYNFDETIKVAKFIPFKYPNILCNNLSGIAVGMATKIPSFNMIEVCEATKKYILEGEHTNLIPDYPTGGYIMNNEDNIENINKTGSGTIYIKSKVEVDEKNRTIVVKEIPYSTTREAIISKIIELIKDKKLLEVSDVEDLSGKRGQNISIYYKRGVDVNKLLDKLFATTPLVSTDSANMNVLCEGHPKQMGTHSIIEEWVKLRRNAISRSLTHKIDKKNEKLSLLNGLAKVLLDLDKTINIIRFEENPEEALMKEFDIDLNQAEYICNMQLRNINKAKIEKRILEIKELEEEIKYLQSIHNTEGYNKIICDQLDECIKKYGVPRNSEIIDYEIRKIEKTARKIEDSKEYRVILTKENYIKKTAQNGEVKIKDGDKIIQEFVADGNSEVACFLDDCTCRKIKIKDIPESNANSLGEYLPVVLGLRDQKIISSMLIKEDTDGFVLAIYRNNKINKININEYKINRKIIEKCYNPDSKVVYLKYHNKDLKLKIQGNKKSVVINTSDMKSKGRTAVGVYALPKEEKMSRITYVK
ncbi:MAG: hypothetical protein J6D47_16170 [Peptostreptococcaceae bacterium]|nr:hypothetical protein [Peptostreptococcaceae bacterium]